MEGGRDAKTREGRFVVGASLRKKQTDCVLNGRDYESYVKTRYATYPLRFLFTSEHTAIYSKTSALKHDETEDIEETEEGDGWTLNNSHNCVWVYALSFGGGMVSADEVAFSISVEENARCLLTTQGSTKIFKATASTAASDNHEHVSNANSAQIMNVEVENNALLLIVPGVIACFRAARYKQCQEVQLRSASSSLFLLDWYSSGRINRERWEFEYFETSTRVTLSGRVVFSDKTILDSTTSMKTSIADSMNNVNVIATVLLIGPITRNKHMKSIVNEKAYSFDNVLRSAAPLESLRVKGTEESTGYVVRYAGTETSAVRERLKVDFSFLSPLAGVSCDMFGS